MSFRHPLESEGEPSRERILMRGAIFVLVLVTPILLASFALAQQAKKFPRVCVLDPSPPSSPYFDGLKEGLTKLGYVEGRNIQLEPRFAEGKYERLLDLALELVRLNCDVIVTVGGPATAAAKKATQTTPIVMGYSGEPVEAGFIASLARPGGNITGLSFFSSELAGKRLELLKSVAPELSRVAVLSNPSHPGERLDWSEAEKGAKRLNIVLQYVAVKTPADLDDALSKLSQAGLDGIFIVPDALTISQRQKIADWSLRAGLPTMAAWSEYTKAGALMSYGPNLRDAFRRAASYVDKILKGAKPAELPVEQPMRLELTINLRTARALGLTIPESVLIQADEVIR